MRGAMVALAAGLLFAAPASAWSWDQPGGDDARARELYDNGAILYEEGRYEDAIIAWREAWRLSERPLLLYNIANAQERLGLWREALETLNHYRALARADERESLDRRIANLERRLTEDRPRAPSPEAVPEPTRPTISAPPPRPKQASAFPWAPVTLYSVGGLGLATGTMFAVRAGGARQDAEAHCTTLGSSVLCSESAADPLRRDTVSSWVADGSFVLGGAAVIGGTLFLLLDSGALRMGPLPGGLSVRGTF